MIVIVLLNKLILTKTVPIAILGGNNLKVSKFQSQNKILLGGWQKDLDHIRILSFRILSFRYLIGYQGIFDTQATLASGQTHKFHFQMWGSGLASVSSPISTRRLY